MFTFMWRALLAGLLLLVPGGVIAAATSPRITSSMIIDGYPVRLDSAGKITGPGWSAGPGQYIGFALNGSVAITGSIRIFDATGRVVATIPGVKLKPQTQRSEDPWRKGAGYGVSVRWRIPSTMKSGVYYVEKRPDLFFVVPTKPGSSGVGRTAVLISTNTFNAYSRSAGRSLYSHPTRVTSVSFLRPFDQVKAHEWVSTVEWITRDAPFAGGVRFLSDFEMEDERNLRGVDLLIALGHSEYWTRKARQTFDTYVANGNDVIMAGGNDMWWQVRLSEGHERMIGYKDDALLPLASGGDPTPDPMLRTTYWIEPALAYPPVASIGGDFRHGGFSKLRRPEGAGWMGLRVISGAHPLLAGSGLADCDLLKLPSVTEYDGAPVLGLDDRGRPIADLQRVGAYRFQLLAYDWGHREGHTLGTMHLMQRTPASGIVLHLGGKDCCGSRVLGPEAEGSGLRIRAIMSRFATRVRASQSVFTTDARTVRFPLSTPWTGALPSGIAGKCAPGVPGQSLAQQMPEGEAADAD